MFLILTHVKNKSHCSTTASGLFIVLLCNPLVFATTVSVFACSSLPHWVELKLVVGVEKFVSHWFPPGPFKATAEQQWLKKKRRSAASHNSVTGKWNHVSERKAIRIFNYLSYWSIVCRSADLSWLCPCIALPFSHSVAVMSGRVVMLCWFIAWLAKWNRDGKCLSLWRPLDRNTCDAQGQLTVLTVMGPHLS